MNNIGKRIKELRKKNDLTQEKLAGYLNVSFQSVSKWENGINTPDLSLIVPLAKILHTTTDELLGHIQSPEENDVLRENLEKAWKAERYGMQRGEQMIAAAEALTTAFPENFVYWEWLGYGERLRAMEYREADDMESAREMLEKSLGHYQMVIEDGEGYWREEALEQAVYVLCNLDRREEAAAYADLLPKGDVRRDRVDRVCRSKEERIRIMQEQRNLAMRNFINELHELSGTQLIWPAELVIDIIQNMIPDGNYLGYHNDLYIAWHSAALWYSVHGRYDDAMDALRHAWIHAKAKDEFNSAGKTCCYTAPLMDRLTSKGWRSRHSYVKVFIRTFALNSFDLLRDREDFKQLEQECREYLEAHPWPKDESDS